MPTIEIISIAAPIVPELPQFKGFAYIAESGVVSHRGFFQDVLDKETGVIVHLANKEFEGDEDGGWFAGHLMEWEDTDSDYVPVRFQQHRFSDVVNILKIMLSASPKNEAIFLTDYQFGPEERTIIENIISIADFSELHQQGELTYNTLYRIKK